MGDNRDWNDRLREEGLDGVRERFDQQEGRRYTNGEAVAARPFEYVDYTLPKKPRAWFIPDRAVTLLSGNGAIGKSLIALQACAATVLGRDWITMLPEAGPAMFYTAEDDADEIGLRLETIAGHYGVTCDDLHAAGLWVVSRAGADAILGMPDRTGIIRPTPMFDQLRADAVRIRPKLIAIDTAADVFAGNEIDRAQTRQFITILRGLGMETGAAVVLLSHPSLAGLKSGNGLSGSTAWHNSVRARMYLAAVKEEDDDDEGAPAEAPRKLAFVKNNYGPAGAAVVLRWRNGIFAPEPTAGSLDALAAEMKADDAFLVCLDAATARAEPVGTNSRGNFAPRVFARMPEASGCRQRALVLAMNRLLTANRIKVEKAATTRERPRSWLARAQ